MRRALFTAAVLLSSVTLPFRAAAQASPLPPLPGQEEPSPPLPGSTEVGQNPLNAIHLDTMMTIEGLFARGFGVAVGYERSFGTILGAEVEVGYLGAAIRDVGSESSLNLVSFLGGLRLSVMQTAVNGPSVGLSLGVATVWISWNSQVLPYTWPQARIDVAMKYSFGVKARGYFVEPRIGYKVVLRGAETEGLPDYRYGGFTIGVRAGYSF